MNWREKSGHASCGDMLKKDYLESIKAATQVA